MRIIHTIKAINIAGAERHLLMLVRGLRERNLDVQIVLIVEPKRPLDHFVAEAESYGVPVHREIIRHHLDISLINRLKKRYQALKPDIVHTHLLHADLYGIPAARLAKVPVIITSRHNDNAFRRRLPMRAINMVLWRMVTAGITISEALRHFSIHVEHAPAKKLHTILYGLDHSANPAKRSMDRDAFRAELNADDHTLIIGMACRLTEQKGIPYALEAFAKIAPEFPNARLVIAGDGALRDKLYRQARKLDIVDRVHFLGWRDDIFAVMAGFDLFLMPSLWEGFGLVMLEAMAQRLPIIGSNISAIPEVVADGVTGYLVPPRDVDAIAEKLTLLLADPPLRQHMGLLGEDRLEEYFTADRMTDQTHALYRQLRDSKKS